MRAGSEALPGSAVAGAIGARLVTVSCTSAGNCAAGGEYFTGSGHGQALVVSEVNGVWGRAQEVPGIGALNTAVAAEVGSVSCTSAGNCSAGGFYTGDAHAPRDQQAFVVSEVNGVWGKAEEVPGLAALNTGYSAGVGPVSCGAAGNCSAGGTYDDSSLREHAFVVSEVHGIWGKAEQVPGTTGIGNAQLVALSCTSAGTCAADGFDTATQAFVASEVNGVWGKAEAIPGLAALNQGHSATASGLSCTSAGTCGADGFYTDSAGDELAFVASEVHGVWGKAEQIPGATAPRYQMAEPVPMSCTSAGNCSTGGQFGGPRAVQAFVASEVNGVWGKAEQVPGSGVLNTAHLATVSTVSCGAAGNCSAGGSYTTSAGEHAFVASRANGVWGNAEQVPGLAALNTGVAAEVTSMSCASAGNCSAAGYYTGNAGSEQAFVVSQVNGAWGKAQEIHGPAA